MCSEKLLRSEQGWEQEPTTWSSLPDLADHFLNSPVEGAVSLSLSVHMSFVLKTSQGIFKTLSTVLEARDHEARKGSTEESEAGGRSASLRLTGLHGTFQAVQGYTVRPC